MVGDGNCVRSRDNGKYVSFPQTAIIEKCSSCSSDDDHNFFDDDGDVMIGWPCVCGGS